MREKVGKDYIIGIKINSEEGAKMEFQKKPFSKLV